MTYVAEERLEPSPQRNPGVAAGNPLKLGVFGFNCSSGRTYSTLPERWVASWDNNLRVARLAEEAGIECLIPIARWRGYGGETNPNGSSFESITWACGMLSATHRINVFGTVHVPLNHPLIAARQMVTADHIGRGRFGLNLVCGWNEDEFQMFGIDKLEHDDRYAQGEEWWSIIRRVWSAEGPFDFEGVHYRLRGVEGAPVPYGGRAPPMMNAGNSPAGRLFAIRYSNLHFDLLNTPQASAERIADTKRQAQALGRQIQVWTPIGIVCRPTMSEAEAYVQHCVEHADWGAIGYLADRHARDAADRTDPEGVARREGGEPLERRVLARGNYCAIGDPDTVARQLAQLSEAGFDGLAINFVDYLKEIPYFAQEVLPRLERLGLRTSGAE